MVAPSFHSWVSSEELYCRSDVEAANGDRRHGQPLLPGAVQIKDHIIFFWVDLFCWLEVGSWKLQTGEHQNHMPILSKKPGRFAGNAGQKWSSFQKFCPVGDCNSRSSVGHKLRVLVFFFPRLGSCGPPWGIEDHVAIFMNNGRNTVNDVNELVWIWHVWDFFQVHSTLAWLRQFSRERLRHFFLENLTFLKHF